MLNLVAPIVTTGLERINKYKDPNHRVTTVCRLSYMFCWLHSLSVCSEPQSHTVNSNAHRTRCAPPHATADRLTVGEPVCFLIAWNRTQRYLAGGTCGVQEKCIRTSAGKTYVSDLKESLNVYENGNNLLLLYLQMLAQLVMTLLG